MTLAMSSTQRCLASVQEWPDKDPGEEIDLYNVNVPLDLRDESFAANRGTAVVTTVDHTSQYSSLYGGSSIPHT